MSVEDTLSKINRKFKLLSLEEEETQIALRNNQRSSLQRQFEVYQITLKEIYELKRTAKEQKIEAEEEIENIKTWNQNLNLEIQTFDGICEELSSAIKQLDYKQQKDGEDIAETLRKKRFDEELELEEMKIKLRNQAAKDKVETAKLPKLTITPFKGTLLDWQRFWNQFSSEIDTKEMNAVTKLSYLRELVEPKVQVIINGLPFTTEGYARAKSVLQAKYGRPSEVANAHVQAILNMEAVQFNNKHDIRKVHTFYEGLLTNVQVLETMGKLKDIKGYVRLTLDKLPDIRADLVRTDDDWHDWDFDHLLKALQKWTERNPVEILIQQKRDEYRNVSRNQPNRFSLQTRMNKQPVFNSICVYCEKSHKSTECDVLSSTGERKRYLADKKLCFNCVKPRHHANQCESKNSCRICNKRHHTSICENNKEIKRENPRMGKPPQ